MTTPCAWAQLPWLAVADTKVTPAGSVSRSVASGAPIGPVSATVAVYVSWSPTRTGSGEAASVTPRSASGGAVVVASHVSVGGVPHVNSEFTHWIVPDALWTPVNVPLNVMSPSSVAVCEKASFVISARSFHVPVSEAQFTKR